jgi:hypothetical protein
MRGGGSADDVHVLVRSFAIDFSLNGVPTRQLVVTDSDESDVENRLRAQYPDAEVQISRIQLGAVVWRRRHHDGRGPHFICGTS